MNDINQAVLGAAKKKRHIVKRFGIIRQDFEAYISDIQDYFRCLEQERARAFEEAREVSQDYGRFLEMVGD